MSQVFFLFCVHLLDVCSLFNVVLAETEKVLDQCHNGRKFSDKHLRPRSDYLKEQSDQDLPCLHLLDTLLNGLQILG